MLTYSFFVWSLSSNSLFFLRDLCFILLIEENFEKRSRSFPSNSTDLVLKSIDIVINLIDGLSEVACELLELNSNIITD